MKRVTYLAVGLTLLLTLAVILAFLLMFAVGYVMDATYA
jgi:hypothetical protein